MTVTVFNEPVHPGACIVGEEENFYSRDAVTVAASQTIVVGQVLGVTANVALVTAAALAVAGNAGDGAVTLDPTAPIRADVIDGVYQIEFITAGAAAEFNLLDPDGRIVGTGAVGTPFVGPLKFAIADDAAKHYAAGDRILLTVEVPPAAQQFAALNPTATDGTENAVAVAIYPAATGVGQTTKVAAIVRQAQVRASDLTWPAGASAAQIAEGTLQLRKRGIVLR